MKQLIAIAVCGVAGILLLAFAAEAGFNMLRGQPIAHATGIWAAILRNGLVFAIVAVSVIVYWIVTWFYPENVLAFVIRWWKSR